MKISTLLRVGFWRRFLRGVPESAENGISAFEFPVGADISEDIKRKYGFDGDLLRIFIQRRSASLVHKWHHYIPIYDRYFSPFRNRNIRFLEIGVSRGGSLEMWRQYLGPQAIIFGIDVDPECGVYDGRHAQVRIGSQSNHDFLASVVEEMGGIDVVLDDGSHNMKDVVATLRFLFPKLNSSGIYLIEDLHTAYWKKYGGGYASPNNFFNFVRDLADDMHHWYHGRPMLERSIGESCTALHLHDSIVVLEKNTVHPPVHSQVRG